MKRYSIKTRIFIFCLSSISSQMVASGYRLVPFLQGENIIAEPVLPANAPVKVLFFHGYSNDENQGHTYTDGYGIKDGFIVRNAGFFPKEMMHTFNFQDSPAVSANLVKMSCLGQDEDVQRGLIEYKKLILAGYKVFFAGESRGAVTLINLLGTYYLKNCVGALAESPFGHTRNLTVPIPDSAIPSKTKKVLTPFLVHDSNIDFM